MTVSTIRRRDPRGDWSLDADYGYRQRLPQLGNSSSFWYSASPVFRLTLSMTVDQARELMEEVYGLSRGSAYRGSPSFDVSRYDRDVVFVRDIEVTAQEAEDIVRSGAHPLDVLFGPAWDCGYMLKVVPAPLS